MEYPHSILKRFTFLPLFLVFSSFAFAGAGLDAREVVVPKKDYSLDKRKIIGRIVSLQSNNPKQKTLLGELQSAEGRWIREGESIFTVEGQRVKVLMDEDTSILIGPSTRVEFVNWTKRDSSDRRIRKLNLDFGFVWLAVSRVYSQEEPLLVTTKQGVVAVRGTEFTVETGEGGHLVKKRSQMKQEIENSRFETEVHVFEGEVSFSKGSDLRPDRKMALVHAGEFSLIRDSMAVVQEPRKFNLEQYESYVRAAVPDAKFALNKRSTKEFRSRLATSVEKNRLPYSRSVENSGDQLLVKGNVAGRGIASEQTSEQTNQAHHSESGLSAIEQNSILERRKYFIDEATVKKRRDKLLAPND